MNLTPRWIGVLVAQGFSAIHWADVGAHDTADHEIMAYARANNYVVLTHDLDFSAILAATQGEKPSVVQIRAENTDPDKIGDQVMRALHQMAAELDEGALLTVDASRTRLRLLPLPPRR
jgi:predicted nuclease of predicted toxin-antitoxin system